MGGFLSSYALQVSCVSPTCTQSRYCYSASTQERQNWKTNLGKTPHLPFKMRAISQGSPNPDDDWVHKPDILRCRTARAFICPSTGDACVSQDSSLRSNCGVVRLSLSLWQISVLDDMVIVFDRGLEDHVMSKQTHHQSKTTTHQIWFPTRGERRRDTNSTSASRTCELLDDFLAH
jgi:hypothetical protein